MAPSSGLEPDLCSKDARGRSAVVLATRPGVPGRAGRVFYAGATCGGGSGDSCRLGDLSVIGPLVAAANTRSRGSCAAARPARSGCLARTVPRSTAGPRCSSGSSGSAWYGDRFSFSDGLAGPDLVVSVRPWPCSWSPWSCSWASGATGKGGRRRRRACWKRGSRDCPEPWPLTRPSPGGGRTGGPAAEGATSGSARRPMPRQRHRVRTVQSGAGQRQPGSPAVRGRLPSLAGMVSLNSAGRHGPDGLETPDRRAPSRAPARPSAWRGPPAGRHASRCRPTGGRGRRAPRAADPRAERGSSGPGARSATPPRRATRRG